MSAKKEIYNLLTGNADLTAMLAKSVIDPLQPAIYDAWPGDNAVMPYMIYSMQNNEGQHWAQVAADLQLDIFSNSGDTTEAEAIKDKALEVLAWQKITNSTEGIITIYPGGNDSEIQEPEPGVCHWNIDFLVKYWRQSLIAAVTNK